MRKGMCNMLLSMKMAAWRQHELGYETDVLQGWCLTSPKSKLCILCHSITLIQDDEFKFIAAQYTKVILCASSLVDSWELRASDTDMLLPFMAHQSGLSKHFIQLNVSSIKYHEVPEHGACACKVHHLLSYDSYPSVVWCIHLQHHVCHRFPIDLAGNCQDGRGLSCSRWPIKQEVGQPIFVHQLLYCSTSRRLR